MWTAYRCTHRKFHLRFLSALRRTTLKILVFNLKISANSCPPRRNVLVFRWGSLPFWRSVRNHIHILVSSFMGRKVAQKGAELGRRVVIFR